MARREGEEYHGEMCSQSFITLPIQHSADALLAPTGQVLTMTSTSAILGQVEGIGLLGETIGFPPSVPIGGRGAVATHFISYSRLDGREFALRLCDAMRRDSPSVEVFIDANIRPGDSWDWTLSRAIDDCETFLFVMTRDSVGEQSGCALELARAVQCKKYIIPLRLHRDAPAPFLLGTRQWLEVSGEFHAAVAGLRDHLQWVKSPDGRIRQLRYQLADAERVQLSGGIAQLLAGTRR